MISIYNVAAVQVFTGLSTDTKPATAPQGSRFIATDTPAVFVFLGAAWVNASTLAAAGITVLI